MPVTRSMKERVAEQGGMFLCAFTTERGGAESRRRVWAKGAQDARRRVERAFGGALAAFAVRAYVC